MVRTKKIPSTNGKNAREIRTQLCYAHRRGVSALGTKFSKNDVVVKIESIRCTGEVFYLTTDDLDFIRNSKPGKYKTTKSWADKVYIRRLKEQGLKTWELVYDGEKYQAVAADKKQAKVSFCHMITDLLWKRDSSRSPRLPYNNYVPKAQKIVEAMKIRQK